MASLWEKTTYSDLPCLPGRRPEIRIPLRRTMMRCFMVDLLDVLQVMIQRIFYIIDCRQFWIKGPQVAWCYAVPSLRNLLMQVASIDGYGFLIERALAWLLQVDSKFLRSDLYAAALSRSEE